MDRAELCLLGERLQAGQEALELSFHLRQYAGPRPFLPQPVARAYLHRIHSVAKNSFHGVATSVSVIECP